MTSLRLSGFHRRIRLHPYPDRIVAGLEDNLHFFATELSHAAGRIDGIRVKAERYPWNICPGAATFLSDQLAGRQIEAIANLDMSQHCTHLFELAVLSAAHAGDERPVQFDLHVDDWAGDCTKVSLFVDGQPDLECAVRCGEVEGAGQWSWRNEIAPADREKAMLVARAVYVSLGRAAPVVDRAVERGPRVLGVCYSYQRSRVEDAAKMSHSRREFDSEDRGPLADFDPVTVFAD